MARRSASTSIPPPARRAVLACHGETLEALLDARAALGTFIALALLRHVLRLVPTLAIGLAIDRVATTRAGATLTAIVSGLCVIAVLEAIFASAQSRLQAALRQHAAAAVPHADRRAAAAQGAAIELVAAFAAAPPVIAAMVAAIAMANPGLALLVVALLGAQLAITLGATLPRRRTAWQLHDADAALHSWRTNAGSGFALGTLGAGVARRSRERVARRDEIEARLERQRAATVEALGLTARLGFAVLLGAASLEVMAALITPGALVATMLVLRQLQGLAEGMSAAWLRVVERAPAAAAASAHRQAPAGAGPRTRAERMAIELAPGSFVAVVGRTGAGKSHLLRLLAERHDASGLDGTARTSIAWVAQEPLLCDVPVIEALRLAAPQADSARLDAALRMAQLDPLLRQLPLGAEQACGPRGEALPSGMRHLVALACALARDPRILVLDALPEAIDAPLRRTLLAALQAWRRDDRILVVATASPAWIAAADRIVLLERGRVRADIRPPQRGAIAKALAAAA